MWGMRRRAGTTQAPSVRILELSVAGLAIALIIAAITSRAEAALAPATYDLAITIDDVPWTGRAPTRDSVLGRSRRMLDVLLRHRAPVAIFVSCRPGTLTADAVRLWSSRGATVGNHTAGHLDLHRTPPSTFADGVRQCDRELRQAGAVPRYFRYPALHQGVTAAQRDTARSVLAALGYRNAPVSIDNNDFLLVEPYRIARNAGDAKTMDRLGREMLQHDMAAVRHFRAFARKFVGREVPQILLLHINDMTVDMMDVLLNELTADGARFVTMEAALSDSTYSRPDRYRGPIGASWLYRIAAPDALTLPAEAAWDSGESRRLQRLIASLRIR
jgi:peptidoglycan/xylan/chitin deacetylase (PgdA/CDA1 family)